MDIWKELEAEGVNRHLLAEVRSFRDAHGVAEEVRGRIPNPRFVYYGKDVWEAAAAAVLCGENLLLAGPKATGKNVLAENLAALFGRPVWDISMHINVDAASLIGTDTLKGGEVCFREGRPHRHRYAEGRRGLLPGRPCVPVRAAGRLRHSGRGEYGEKRSAGRAPRHAGFPPGH